MSDIREELAPWQRADKALLEEIVNACGFSHYDECDGVLALIARARAEEIEACAKACEDLIADGRVHSNFMCAAAIRARAPRART